VGAKLRKVFVALAVTQAVAAVVGQLLSRRRSWGDERSEEFRVEAITAGRRFVSTAPALRAGAVVATMGGVDVDLRGATLDPGGATLDVRTTMGGVQISVPEHWAVTVDRHVVAGGVDVQLAPPEDLPADAPRLHVRAAARNGGISITNGHRPDHRRRASLRRGGVLRRR
jgi:hypothetical protein